MYDSINSMKNKDSMKSLDSIESMDSMDNNIIHAIL